MCSLPLKLLSQKGCGKCRMPLNRMGLFGLIFLHWCKLFSFDEPYLPKLGIGTQMSLPVGVKPVWWCITSQLQTLAWEGHTFTSGTMIDATWSTILSANMPQVRKSEVIFHQWDIVLILWGNLQVSFGLWYWFLSCVPELAIIGDMSITTIKCIFIHLNKPVYIQ